MTITTDSGHVLVRMRNVGFGDGFLVVLPGPKRPLKVLFDCGSHMTGAGPRPMTEVVEQIIDDVTEDGTARIDVVVATHRHRDHVSGFEDPRWRDVEVGEVWMPWTEHPTDPAARRIRERQSSVARRLELGLNGATAPLSVADKVALELASNALTNDKAMTTLHRGFAGPPVRRFLQSEREAEARVLETPALPGVRVHVLGPARDVDVIRDMDPPTGEAYLRITAAARQGPARALFPEEFRLPADTAPLLTASELERVHELADENPLAVAVALEKAVNGTSVVLVLEIGDAFMLFPGDAQWGTWRRILDDQDMSELVRRTTFLKVGHHGSHNATPKRLVKLLASRRSGADAKLDDFVAMVSTRAMPMWHEIPKTELMKALEELTPILARTDTGAQDFIDASIPVR